MILNFDRQRIFIFGAIAVFFILIAGFYHAPDYVPKEVSRMKTSVSTWLKGSEPSLDDELYKDSPHFSIPKKPAAESPKSQNDHKVQETVEFADTFPQPGFGIVPEEKEVAAPIIHIVSSVQHDTPAAAQHTSAPAVHIATAPASLPSAQDFINVLPPVDAFPNAELATNAEYAMSRPDYTHKATHTALPTTLATHIKAAATAHAPFEDEKWTQPEQDV